MFNKCIIIIKQKKKFKYRLTLLSIKFITPDNTYLLIYKQLL